MINKTQESFSIQDLELLSGIKAHTIRIWEKRYNILNPKRLNRNIRVYNLSDLKKILNISLLVKDAFKISELAAISNQELTVKAKSISLKNAPSNYYINTVLISMFLLDEVQFEEIHQKQKQNLSFTEIFLQTYIPVLNRIGTLWQTNEVPLVYEHFISNLIYRKIALNIELLPKVSPQSKKVYVLFLPQGELHELGLFFLTYLLKKKGKRTIYIGANTPIEKLMPISAIYDEISWVCSLSINRTKEEKEFLLNKIEIVLKNTHNTCSLITNDIFDKLKIKCSSNIYFYKNPKIFIDDIL